MPLFLVRRERCVPYTVVIEAPSIEEAEAAAPESLSKWNEEPEYWQDLETEEVSADDGYCPDIVLGEDR